MRVTAHAVAFHLPVHKNASFHGWEQKNDPAVHENGGFLGRGPGYFVYLHDLGVILSVSEGSVNRKYKLTLYKMAEFKDGIPILIHLFEVDKYRFCK